MSEHEKNQQVADHICHHLQWNDRQFAIGDCLALLDGQIVAVILIGLTPVRLIA